MATRQGIDTAISSRLGADAQQMFFAVKAEFDTDDIRVWSGIDDITVNSETYTGAGTLLSISGIEEDLELKSNGLSISVSGMDSTMLDYALTENYQNRPITVFLGFQMGGSNESAGEMTLFKGRMTSLQINDTPDGATITIDCENRLVDLSRPSNLRYTVESQEFLHSGDTGFNRVQSLADKQIAWGQKQDVTRSNGRREDTDISEIELA
ncbi:hypothetical protein [Marinobacter sp.]|uniref:hypothetical protein n=1 Tax=Marinobacter sp. TaxID=50741 RepID=UPI00257F1448|nr:hypothetical protein [Marinobacter sp.]